MKLTNQTFPLMPNTSTYKDWLFVKVPDVEGWEIRGEHSKRPYQLLSFYGEAEAIQLPPGSWQIIGKGDAIDWEGIVEARKGIGIRPYYGYVDYGSDVAVCSTATESGHSLLRSLKMEPSETLILKKNEK